ncbi:DUF805 domain-containing protein [Jannaschia pohangensis]|uniref:Uncharacterized membrane protein YhaH, DUF805 family n=1 Tax=Jannaschia pohangensis TaxID=390807 RepID=A0A1I3MEY7_9RHOB|nr:DUF805 domain-containing protein [Jannaschia pohangensis]SFI95512.1 Uncharacterized membrane protein YhaH, DUF805 family [Jannaschia pohangensis]
MTFAEAITTCLQKYFDVTGRASRSEYWWFYFGIVAFVLVFVLLSFAAPAPGAVRLLVFIAFLGLLPPHLAVMIRRLHDIDLRGWWILIAILPFGGLALLVMTVLPGTEGPNRFGPDPTDRRGGPGSAPPRVSKTPLRPTSIPRVRPGRRE